MIITTATIASAVMFLANMAQWAAIFLCIIVNVLSGQHRTTLFRPHPPVAEGMRWARAA
ncbi:MAG: hypothetical protein V3R80_05600 [Candidatus Tectomicrobia bacterium]